MVLRRLQRENGTREERETSKEEETIGKQSKGMKKVSLVVLVGKIYTGVTIVRAMENGAFRQIILV
jgi:hypothetical protein